MIEESEKLKSTAESKASNLADNLVPYPLAGTILTYLITRNATRAISILMVDFSCALKLAMPVAVLSAMREGRMHDIASTVDEKRVVIGSYRFVFQDEGCIVADENREAYDNIRDDCSRLFMAIDGRLAAVILIWDSFRYEAVEVVKDLHALGIKRVVIMTGDNRKIAQRIANATSSLLHNASTLAVTVHSVTNMLE